MTIPVRRQFLGLPLDLCTEPELTAMVIELARDGGRHHSGHINTHALTLARRDPEMARFYATASLCPLDSVPLIPVMRLCGIPASWHHRATYIDWIRPLMRAAAEAGLRVFSLGGKPGTGERAARVLSEEIPGLEIGVHHGYFDRAPRSDANRAVLATIREYRPQLLLVGMGMPRQERWILREREALPSCVVLAAGACMDYVAGIVPTPPRWTARLGFEWLARLLADPRRLAHRYLIEPWELAPVIARELIRRRQR